MNVCSTEKRLHNYIHVLRCAHVREATIYAKLDTPVGCVPSACQQHVFWWPPLDVSTGRGWYTFPMMYTHPSLQAQVGVGVYNYPKRDTHPSPWTEGQTDTYENVTFPQLLLRTVITFNV